MLLTQGPLDVMNGIPSKVAVPVSSTTSLSATLSNALLALLPGGAGSDGNPLNDMTSPIADASGGASGTT